ncbi:MULTISPECIES: hypothetical protein [Flavobacterium]|uniref:Uncharacterized protein n=1 Tax=Flavobacterium keumense TaxID=1306518 RepID=A0ABY8N6E7_9FLAO|nr:MULTISPECIES: hypothetical protein [Flavobacterium]WGK94196.1 hypothetical protein MG292_08915 [Flavobacterium keumense]
MNEQLFQNKTKQLMSLNGQTVRIIVSEPWDWKEILFGKILSDRGGNKLLVKLTKPLTGDKLTSDLIELSPRYEKTTFKTLLQHYSVTVAGALVTENPGEFDYIIIGSVILD